MAKTQAVRDDTKNAQGAIPFGFNQSPPATGPDNVYDEMDDFSLDLDGGVRASENADTETSEVPQIRGKESSDPDLPGKEENDLSRVGPVKVERVKPGVGPKRDVRILS